ncbi:hypothetical protein SAMN05444266_112137 [Chitinophaga jiangningensis]|uniref:Uncharacterized protein n=1 Tax=Chitinophaga jiangningensis TaxID=1419482 RepID=A0A1M7M935_9BACT|nr:hypothetical protein SAMN05444266_112137 [Chitinophaga jiangningensis]
MVLISVDLIAWPPVVWNGQRGIAVYNVVAEIKRELILQINAVGDNKSINSGINCRLTGVFFQKKSSGNDILERNGEFFAVHMRVVFKKLFIGCLSQRRPALPDHGRTFSL